MTIEVKQMLVKSTVVQKEASQSDTSSQDQPQDVTEMKENILTECRRIIIDVLREQQER